ncbi:phosphotransferase family protein [Tothia fuscella]|uniref:Phosphotransferase family protein n=1 Tax=Tothia fuscella TaxID=1048955 RepID=A0A9P4U2E3_9PEZI|nr:phosphotransferase family protein [Tothia fuscella]
MAPTQHDEHYDYFHYTSGRWLWGEEEQLRERSRVFNVAELQKVAMGIAGSQKCVSMSKIGEGNFNKVFRLQMDDGSILMARIPHPNAGPPKYTTASEVATMDFAHSILDIPVPKVLAYSTTADNPVGSEYIIMEEAKGTQLSEVWEYMDVKDQLVIITELVTIDQKFLSASLNRHGALYYKKDSFPGCETAQVTASIMDSLRADVEKRFVIGPTVEREFWEKQRADMAIDRGPSMERWGASKGQNSPQAHIDLLGKYISVIAQLLPNQPELLTPILWHRDLHTGNLFIKDGKISSVIDWQSSWVGPLILRARAPRLLDYNGEIILKLPPTYEEMPEDERRLVEYQMQQSMQIYSYEHKTAGRNPLLDRVLRYPQGKMLSNVVEFASTSWNGDILPLRDCLIRIERNWKEHTDSTTSCPYHFSVEEIRKSQEDAGSYNDMRDFWDDLKGRVDNTGYTTYEFFDDAVALFSSLRENGLKTLEGQELKDFEEQTRWVLDHVKNKGTH